MVHYVRGGFLTAFTHVGKGLVDKILGPPLTLNCSFSHSFIYLFSHLHVFISSTLNERVAHIGHNLAWFLFLLAERDDLGT